jgi:CRISPR/Cas system-associated exonuclease Cas4 (RecB family)
VLRDRLTWALAHPEAARVVQAEQLELPEAWLATSGPTAAAGSTATVEVIVERLEQLCRPPPQATAFGERSEQRLSFSQLHQFDVCPVRYRFQQVWRVPAPPDELLNQAAAASGGAGELGASIHRALAAWHTVGGDLLELYSGPESGREMLRGYLEQPLASARTLGCELEFNLRLDGTWVTGVVDGVCELDGLVALVDYKTNARLDERLRQAYAGQLRLYGLAAARGLLPGGERPRLVLFDLRRGEAIDIEPDASAAEASIVEAASRIEGGDFELRPEHRDRPCFLCAYRPICPDRRGS